MGLVGVEAERVQTPDVFNRRAEQGSLCLHWPETISRNMMEVPALPPSFCPISPKPHIFYNSNLSVLCLKCKGLPLGSQVSKDVTEFMAPSVDSSSSAARTAPAEMRTVVTGASRARGRGALLSTQLREGREGGARAVMWSSPVDHAR